MDKNFGYEFSNLDTLEINFDENYEFNNFNNCFIFDNSSLTEIPNIFSIIISSPAPDNNNNNNSNREKKDNNTIEICLKEEKEKKKEKKGKDENKSFLKKKRKCHNKFAKDNIKRKIQVHYLKFLVKLINKIILEIFKKYNNINLSDKKNIENFQFKYLDYDFTKKIDNASFNSLKSKNLADIFTENTSPKFRILNNRIIYDNIIRINKDINNLLKKPYLEFFNVFYKNESNINLKIHGFNLDISLKDIEKFEIFVEEQKKKTKDYEEYIRKIKDCIEDDFKISSGSHLFIVKSE